MKTCNDCSNRQDNNSCVEKYSKKENAYTFAELLAVLLILGLVAAIITPQIINQMERAKVKAAKLQAQTLVTSVELMSADIGRIPTKEEGIKSLLKSPSNALGWQGPYVKNFKSIMDPWGREYQYVSPGQDGSQFAIVSYGEDGKLGGENSKADIIEN